MSAAVAQVEGREQVTDRGKHGELGPESEPQQAHDPEQQRKAALDEPELIRSKLDVGAGQVTLQPVGCLLGRDPRWRPCRLEATAELLAHVGKGSV